VTADAVTVRARLVAAEDGHVALRRTYRFRTTLLRVGGRGAVTADAVTVRARLVAAEDGRVALRRTYRFRTTLLRVGGRGAVTLCAVSPGTRRAPGGTPRARLRCGGLSLCRQSAKRYVVGQAGGAVPPPPRPPAGGLRPGRSGFLGRIRTWLRLDAPFGGRWPRPALLAGCALLTPARPKTLLRQPVGMASIMLSLLGAGGGRVLVCRGRAVGRAFWWARFLRPFRCAACARRWPRWLVSPAGDISVRPSVCGGVVLARASCRFVASGCRWRGGVCPGSLPVISVGHCPSWAMVAGSCPGLPLR
jgi:hypothetical protein